MPDIDELKSKHSKEKRELQTKITALKHTVTKNDKKKKKEVQLEIESLEKDLKERHQKELEELEATLKATQINDSSAVEESKVEDAEPEVKKLTKTQKQRAKKAETERRRAAAVELDQANTATSRGTIEKEKIEEILKRRDLQIYDIKSDGDCLYNAIAHQINLQSDSKINGDMVRQKAAEYMRKNADEFIPFLEEMDTPEDFQKYCTKVEKSCKHGGDWGSATELKAASLALNRQIEVVHGDGPSHNFGENFETEPLVITYHKSLLALGEHYNSTEQL
ncbi:OTU domain-containing protein [Aphelenchoides bicaudatus]|nr:OTU domain-containing protein [Aphelenchoides bicaudatus]